jgi:hypothetical protein
VAKSCLGDFDELVHHGLVQPAHIGASLIATVTMDRNGHIHMIEELHDKRTALKFHAVAWSVQGKITRGQPASVHVEAGPAVIGYETRYLLSTWFDASPVYGHQTQGAPQVKMFTGVANSSHKDQLLQRFQLMNNQFQHYSREGKAIKLESVCWSQ